MNLAFFSRIFFSLAALAFAVMPTKATGAPAAVDIQFSICAPSTQVEQALNLRQQGAPIQVWLFDDASLSLFAKGLRLRLREAKGGGELTLKAAEQDCAALPSGLLPAGEGKCEYDMHGDKTAGALSLTRSIDQSAMQSLVAGRQALADELSEAQKHFLQQPGGIWPLPSGIRALGPTRVSNFRAAGKNYAVDVSTLPSGDSYIEISQEVAQADAPPVRDKLVAEMQESGVPLCADQSAQAVNKLRKLLAQQ